MKNLLRLFLALASLFLISCGNDDDNIDCSLVECEAPGLTFQFIDQDSGENLIENGEISPESIEIEVSSLQDSEVVFIERENAIFLSVFNWPNGNHEVKVSLNSRDVLELNLDSQSTTSECCPGPGISNIEITAGNFVEVDDHIFQILID